MNGIPSDEARDKIAECSTFNGRFALVIGGSGGIGRAVSLELVRRGARLLVHGRQAEERMKTSSPSSLSTFDYAFDSPRNFIQALDARLADMGAKPDIVICAFGPFLEKPLEMVSPEEWEYLTMANLALPGALVSHFLAGMQERRYGRFLFFGGTRTDTIRPFRKTAAYAAAKTGLDVLAKSIATNAGNKNVAAVVVCPGPTSTEYLNAETRARHSSLTATGSLLPAELIAHASLDLIDDDPCIASGAIVALDGGFDPESKDSASNLVPEKGACR